MSKKIALLYAESNSMGNISSRNIQYKYTKDGNIVWNMIMVDFGKVSRNGHKFDKEEFMKAYNSDSVQERLKGKRFFGELDHPPKDDVERFLTVNLKEASHRINRVWFEGDYIIGEFETMKSKNGDIVRSMIEMNAEIACSWRGCGFPRPDGGEDICWTTWDIVFQPSAAAALSIETSFKMKTYGESTNVSRRDIALANLDFVPAPKASSHNIYAESELPNPTAFIRIGENTIGYSYETEEDKARHKLGKGILNVMKGF